MKTSELMDLQTRTKNLCLELQERPIIAEIFSILQRDLAPELCYHNYTHSLEVFEEAIMLALHDNLADRDIELLAIAAAYHDAGFLYQKEDNEQIAAKMATNALYRTGGYTEHEISLVQEMIEDTKVMLVDHQFTRLVSNDLSKYLLDADLGNLGNPNFFVKNKLILKETGMDEKIFQRLSLSLLRNHRWLTPAGMALKEEQRLKNLERLIAPNN
jgi:uncharacterized protein